MREKKNINKKTNKERQIFCKEKKNYTAFSWTNLNWMNISMINHTSFWHWIRERESFINFKNIVVGHTIVLMFICLYVVTRCLLYVSYHLLSTIIYLFYILLIIFNTSVYPSIIPILQFCILSKFVLMIIYIYMSICAFRKSSKGILRKRKVSFFLSQFYQQFIILHIVREWRKKIANVYLYLSMLDY